MRNSTSAPELCGVARSRDSTLSGFATSGAMPRRISRPRPHSRLNARSSAFDLGDGGARAVARAVVHETHRPRLALRDVVGERGIDLEHDVEVAAS